MEIDDIARFFYVGGLLLAFLAWIALSVVTCYRLDKLELRVGMFILTGVGFGLHIAGFILLLVY